MAGEKLAWLSWCFETIGDEYVGGCKHDTGFLWKVKTFAISSTCVDLTGTKILYIGTPDDTSVYILIQMNVRIDVS